MDRAQWHDLQVRLGYLPEEDAGYDALPDNEGYEDEVFDTTEVEDDAGSDD